MSLKTPIYQLDKFPNVYEPREDSFLLLDALEKDLDNIIHLKPTFVAEVGSGSGVIITALSSIVKHVCFATDINVEACFASRNTSELNDACIEANLMNLLSCFRPNLFDIVVFNPPYVVTESFEISGDGLPRSWAGGADGREVIDKFLGALPNMLSDNGICYLLVLKENNPEQIMDSIREWGWKACVILERKVPCEHLYVLKLCKM